MNFNKISVNFQKSQSACFVYSVLTEQTEQYILSEQFRCYRLHDTQWDEEVFQLQPNDEQHFAEEMGLHFEQACLTRMSGKIMGWLLVADPPHQTMSDLVEALQASKSSISTATRWMIQNNLIQRISLPGERRDFYQIRDDVWEISTSRRNSYITIFRNLAERGLAMLDGESDERKQRLQQMRDFYAFFEREMPKLFAKWNEEQQRKGE